MPYFWQLTINTKFKIKFDFVVLLHPSWMQKSVPFFKGERIKLFFKFFLVKKFALPNKITLITPLKTKNK